MRLTIARVTGDDGPAYTSTLFNKTLAAQGIKHLYTRPYRPQAGGEAEWLNRPLAASVGLRRLLRQ